MDAQNGLIEAKLRNINYHKPFTCDQCGSLVKYVGVGEYNCVRCRNKMYDDYGTIRNYLEENGTATATEIARDTGVSKEVIDDLIREGVLGNVEGATDQKRCVGCGRPVSQGRYCYECIWKVSTELKKAMMNAPASERVSKDGTMDAKTKAQPAKDTGNKKNGRMYFFDED